MKLLTSGRSENYSFNNNNNNNNNLCTSHVVTNIFNNNYNNNNNNNNNNVLGTSLWDCNIWDKLHWHQRTDWDYYCYYLIDLLLGKNTWKIVSLNQQHHETEFVRRFGRSNLAFVKQKSDPISRRVAIIMYRENRGGWGNMYEFAC